MTDAAEEDRLCKQSNEISGFSVFPGQKKYDNVTGWGLPQAYIDKWEAQNMKIVVPISILACLAYKDAVTQIWHGTPMAFLVTKLGEAGLPFDSSTANVVIQPHPLGGDAPPF